MQLNNIFQLPVSRPIEGVIKADDESSLYSELSEYVLTGEVAKEGLQNPRSPRVPNSLKPRDDVGHESDHARP